MEIGSVAVDTATSNSKVVSSVDADAFRSVMRHLVGAVAVITTEGNGAFHGFTATAVCSVCAEPPTVLIAVNKTARTHPHIDRKGFYAINLVSDDQKALAQHFSTKGDDQFQGVSFTLGKSGVPILSGTAASLECQVEDRISVGTHTLFIGRVIGTGVGNRWPLVYHDAKYASVTHI